MSKSTAASVEDSLLSALKSYKDNANAVKVAHRATRQQILDDLMTSDLAKEGHLEALDTATRAKLDGIKADQDAYVNSLRNKVESELRGHQPADANSVLLRRDAADRVRKLTDNREAMEVLNDAIANGDDSLAHAIGHRARNSIWLDVAEAYQAAHPSTADSAQALAYLEANTSGAAYNLANQITYAAPVTD